MARIPYCMTEADLPPEFHDLFNDIKRKRETGVSNIIRALLNAPAVFIKRMAYSNSLRNDTTLERSHRELAILTVGSVTHSEYEFAHHYKAGLKAGLTREKIDAIQDVETTNVFDEKERAIVRFTRDLTLHVTASDEVWASLAAFLDKRQLVELTLLVGWYNQTVRVLAALQVDLEPEYALVMSDDATQDWKIR